MNQNIRSFVQTCTAVLALGMLIVITVSVTAAETEVHFEPQDTSVRCCEYVEVELWINTTNIQGGQINLTYNPNCVNITNWARNTAVFSMGGWTHYEARAWVTFATQDSLSGEYRIGTFTLQCVNARGESCETSLQFVTPSKLFDHTGKSVDANWEDGTFGCNRTLDTGPGTYPSISGTHNGTITPNKTIEVSKLYTYPCTGSGGHTEYARIWNNSGFNATAMWGGYTSDWHKVTFDETVVLLANETYNYTICTGSYPQIHHDASLLTKNVWINCTEFVDANGKIYDDWIPAIRLK